MSFFNRTTLNMTPSAVNSVVHGTHGGQQNIEPKSVHSSMAPNANFVVNSSDRFGGNMITPTVQPLNNFIITRQQNILQGMFESLKVQEINFQWGVPNIVAGKNNELAFTTSENPGVFYNLFVTEGFYTGTQLATTLTDLASKAIGGNPILDNPPIFTYLPNGSFKVTSTSGTVSFGLFDVVNGVSDPLLLASYPINTPNLLFTMGFSSTIRNYSTPFPTLISGLAPMLYTSFIDVCSSQLTQFQNTNDSMTSLQNKNDVIARIYLSDETSTSVVDASGNPVYPGEVPFVLHRQFKNTKVMKWNGQNSIATVDIRLYDQYGQPLYVGGPLNTTQSVGEFQITFTASEV